MKSLAINTKNILRCILVLGKHAYFQILQYLSILGYSQEQPYADLLQLFTKVDDGLTDRFLLFCSHRDHVSRENKQLEAEHAELSAEISALQMAAQRLKDIFIHF